MDDFKKEIVDMFKQHRSETRIDDDLSEERMKSIDKNVYAHIDSLYPAERTNPALSKEKSGGFAAIKEYVADLWSAGWLKPVAAFASIPVIMAGVLAYQINNSSVGVHDLPESLLKQGLAGYIEESGTGSSRAFGELELSDRLKAFQAGVALADIDVINDPKSDAASAVAVRFGELVKSDATGNKLDQLHESAENYSADQITSDWLTQGYAVEIVYLSASSALDGLNAGIATEALSYYLNTTDDSFKNLDEVPPKYLENHNYLLENINAPLTTPDEISAIVEKARQMKLLIR